jgi:ferredoxin-fold anticodon binding domain-containing protein
MNTQEKIAKIQENKTLKVYEGEDINDGSDLFVVKKHVISITYTASQFQAKTADEILAEIQKKWDDQGYQGE